MENFLRKLGRSCYGAAIVVYALQQFIYGNFRNAHLPVWQSYLPALPIWAYLTGTAMIIAGLAVISDKKAKEASLILAGSFLLLFIFIQVPFQLSGTGGAHLGTWTDALKELAMAGGGFIIAGSFSRNFDVPLKKPFLIALPEKIIPLGTVFFSITMICFGIMHFLYAQFVSTLIPSWIPDHNFWTYFSGVVLISAGTAIILRIRQGAVAGIFSLMLFMWFILLHVPRAIAAPYALRGNELSSAFDALAFAGTALIISLKDFKADLHRILNR